MMKVTFWYKIIFQILFLLIPHSSSRSLQQELETLYNHNPNSFVNKYLEYKSICSNPMENIVLPRHDNYNVDLEKYRNWSVESNYFHQFYNIHPFNSSEHVNIDKLMCNSTKDVTISASQLLHNQFCQISWLSPRQVCSILHEYSLVYWLGDSLTRHQTQGLFILMNGDLRFGGIPLSQPHKIYENCQCDGQFSENEICRRPMAFNQDDMVATKTLDNLYGNGFCSQYVHPTHSTTKFIWTQGDYRIVQLKCPDDSNRPIFIFFQGGHHVELSIYYGITTYLMPVMYRFQTELKECWDRVKIAFSGATICDNHLVKKYPHQSPENVYNYNHGMAKWFSEHYPNVEIIDFTNITAESLDRTSDGFHSLTDVNLIKASIVVNVMHHFAYNRTSLSRLS